MTNETEKQPPADVVERVAIAICEYEYEGDYGDKLVEATKGCAQAVIAALQNSGYIQNSLAIKPIEQPSLPQGMTEEQLISIADNSFSDGPFGKFAGTKRTKRQYIEATIRAIVPALSALPGNSVKGVEWQPIETAPKDGTEVFLWILEELYTKCRFHVAKDRWETWELDGLDSMSWVRLEHYEKPTHWMPLPKPPASTDTAKGEE